MSKNVIKGNKIKSTGEAKDIKAPKSTKFKNSDVLTLWDFVVVNLGIKDCSLKQLKGPKYESATNNILTMEKVLVEAINSQDYKKLMSVTTDMETNINTITSHKSIGMTVPREGKVSVISIMNDYLKLKELPEFRITKSSGEYSIRTKDVIDITPEMINLSKECGLDLSTSVSVSNEDETESVEDVTIETVEVEEVSEDNVDDNIEEVSDETVVLENIVAEDTTEVESTEDALKDSESKEFTETDIEAFRKSFISVTGALYESEDEAFGTTKEQLDTIISIKNKELTIRDTLQPVLDEAPENEKFSMNLYVETMERLVDRIINSTFTDSVRVFEENVAVIPSLIAMCKITEEDESMDFYKSITQLFLGLCLPKLLYVVEEPKEEETPLIETSIVTTPVTPEEPKDIETPLIETSIVTTPVTPEEPKEEKSEYDGTIIGMWSNISKGRFDIINDIKW